jgi:flavin reductase (DIM6/NTAB) family NADH-FMN oxidoreductase RutF
MQKVKTGAQTLLYPMIDLQSHVLFVGEIMESYVNSDCLSDGKPDAAKIDPLIYCTGTTQHHRLGEAVGKAFSMGKDQ